MLAYEQLGEQQQTKRKRTRQCAMWKEREKKKRNTFADVKALKTAK